MLTTVVSRGFKQYSPSFKAAVLRQLEVDETSFRLVLSSRKPASRPSHPPVQVVTLPSWCLSKLGEFFSAQEIDALDLTAEEAEHVVKQALFTASAGTTRSGGRDRVTDALQKFRCL